MNEKEREIIRQLTLESLYLFDELIINYTIPKKDRLDLKPFHKKVLDFVQDDSIHRKGIKLPRYFLKTSLITIAKPMWDWLRNPEERILIGGETYSKAQDFLYGIKQHFEGNKLLHYIHPQTELSKEWMRNKRWSSEELDLPHKGIYKEPTIKIVGVGSSIQGLHATRVYLDDLIGKKAMLSPVIREDTQKWFDNIEEVLVQPDSSKSNASHVYLIGTNYAPGDLYETVKEKYPSYKWISVPAEDEEGNPTWPERLGAEEIAKMKAERPMIFYTQMQNNPMDSDLTDFKVEWLKYYTKTTNEDDQPAIKYIDQEKKARFCLIKDMEINATIDPASFHTETLKQLCRTAIVIVGTDKETNLHFVLEAWARRLSKPSQFYDKVFEFNDTYLVRKWGMETFAGGNTLFEGLREKAREEHIYLPLMELPKDVGKDAKINRIRNNLQEAFSTGNLYIHEMQKDLIGEYRAFPMGPTKDILDALAYHRIWWRKIDSKKVAKAYQERRHQYIMSVNPRTGY